MKLSEINQQQAQASSSTQRWRGGDVTTVRSDCTNDTVVFEPSKPPRRPRTSTTATSGPTSSSSHGNVSLLKDNNTNNNGNGNNYPNLIFTQSEETHSTSSSSSYLLCGTCMRFFQSNMSAFVTFLKAMFGVSLLSSPYVINETGLLLGTIAYIIIISACTFACYLILKARAAVASELNDRYLRNIQQHSGGRDGIYRTNNNAIGNHGGSITFGVLGKELFGAKISVLIIFLIVTLHVCFGAGMLASASHQLAVGLNWHRDSYNNGYDNDHNDEGGHHDGDDNDNGNSSSSGYYYYFYSSQQQVPHYFDRFVRVCILFPIVATVLQFRNQFELFLLCSAGLFLYVVGCIGSIFYTTIVLTVHSIVGNTNNNNSTNYYDDDAYNNGDDGNGNDGGHNSRDHDCHEDGDGDGGGGGPGGGGNCNANAPTDMWQWKFSGIPTFVASTVCAIEGINLALPTANSLYQQQQDRLRKLQQRNGTSMNTIGSETASNQISDAIPVVSSVIIVYGILTLAIAWIGYLNGLGGGKGTKHGNDNYNGNNGDNNSNNYNGYNSRACEQIAYCLDSDLLTKIHQISLGITLLLTLPIILYPSIEMLEIWADEREIQLQTGRTSSDSSIQSSGWNGYVRGDKMKSKVLNDKQQKLIQTFGQYGISENSDDDPRVIFRRFDDEGDEKKLSKWRLPKHWRLRLSHAVAISILAVVKRSFESTFALMKGLGLSFVGFMLPCIFFVQAHKKYHTVLGGDLINGRSQRRMSWALKISMVCLVLLGMSNIVLVYLSVFTKHNYMPEHELHRGPGHEEDDQEEFSSTTNGGDDSFD